MRRLRGRKALVTGAASGIGRAIAVALAREGVDLYLVDIDDLNLAVAAQEVRTHGVEAVTRHCDLTDTGQIAATVEALLSHWGRLNILINNAGVFDRRPWHQTSDADWNRTIAINLSAPVALTRMLLPTLYNNPAHVLNVCSIFGLITTRKSAAYQTSKFGLVGFTSALRAEYGSPDFGVTALCPGFVHTPMLEGRTQAQPKLSPATWMATTPDKVATAAVGAIRRNKGMVVVTPAARMSWLAVRMFPGLDDFIARSAWRYWGKGERGGP